MNANETRPAMVAPPAPASLTGTLIGSALVAALGGLLFGFDTVVISGTTEALKTVFSLTESSLGFTVAIALIGTIFGSILAGRPSDVWGRKKALIALAVLYFATSLGSALAWDWISFLVFRFLGGVAVGGASVVSPLYIAEISPAKYRGRLVAIQQFNVVLGILLAFLSNYVIARLHLGATEWRWMLGVLAAPSALFFLLLLPTPESPRWLVGQGRTDEARAVLEQLGVDRDSIDQEVAEIRASIDPEHHGTRRIVVPARLPQAGPPGRGDRRVQPALGDQRDPLLRPADLQDGRAPTSTRRCSRRWPWAGRTWSSRCWRC